MYAARIVFVVLMFVVMAAGAASAQDAGSVGVVMGYPSQVGVLWQVTDRFALRPDVSLSRTSIDTTSTSPFGASSSTDGWTVGFGVSALIRLRQWDAVRTYVAPAVGYTRMRNELTSPTLTQSRTTTSGYTAGGALGVQYRPVRPFGVFGEAGVSYVHSEYTNFGSTASGDSIGTRSAAGVILFF
jgi:opacity protein-like surface antigen